MVQTRDDETAALLASPCRRDGETIDVELEGMLPMISRAHSNSASLSLSLADDELKGFQRAYSDEEEDPYWRHELTKQLKLMLPILATYVLEYLPGLVCIMLVGHIDSPKTKEFVDAATISTMFTNVSALSVGFGLSSALDTLCSQAHGAGRNLKIGLYVQTCMLVVLGICLVPIFLLNWHTEWFMLHLGQDPEVSRLAGEFSRYTVFGTPCLFLYEMLRKAMQAQNIVRPLVAIMVVGNCVNIFGGYYLTYHTAMGFHGAALSRTLGYAALPICVLPYLAISGNYRQWWPGWNLRAAWGLVGVFLHLGIPGFLMMAMEWWAYEILALFAGLLPGSVLAVSAHAVIMNIVSTLYMVYLGMAVSGNILVGNALGANMPKRAQLTSRLTMAMTASVSCAVAALVFVFRFEIPKLLINDPVAVERAATLLLAIVPYEVVDATNCVIQGIYRGTGRQHMAARLNATAFYVVGVPLAALLAFGCQWDVEGLWIGFAAGMAFSLGTCSYVLYHASWQQMADEAQARTAH